jgi:hypothetical protein
VISDPERYRFAADTIAGVATVAVLCVTCHQSVGEDAGTVRVFDFSFPSLADVQDVVDEHETAQHPAS